MESYKQTATFKIAKFHIISPVHSPMNFQISPTGGLVFPTKGVAPLPPSGAFPVLDYEIQGEILMLIRHFFSHENRILLNSLYFIFLLFFCSLYFLHFIL